MDVRPSCAGLPDESTARREDEAVNAPLRSRPAGYCAALALLIIAAAGLFLGACDSNDGEDPTESTVDVAHGDFWVTTSQPSVEEGNVTFEVANEGAIVHEFKVVRSELPPDDLPLNEEEFVVDETQVEVMGFTDPMKPGETRTLTLNMPPGKYVLICNVASHYQAGSYVGFEVVAE